MRPHRWSSSRRMGKHCGKRRPLARAAAASCRGTVLPPAREPAWPGMGSAVNSPAPRAKPPLAALRRLLAALGLLLLGAGDCELHTSCGIQKCTTDFVSFTTHLNSALEDFDLEFCKALRAYSVCTYRNSKVCRGNLVYHSAVLGIGDLMTQRNCTKNGPTSSTNSEITHDPCNYSGHTEVRDHQGGEKTSPPTYLFCGLFGDPHLRTFKDHFQTCKVEGAWPLIDNKYLSVQVTNVPVVPGSSATATNKVTIIFKSYQDCTDQKVYQAMTDDLPAAFVDGTTSGGDEHTRNLHIVEKVGGKYIEMHARPSSCLCYRRLRMCIFFMLGNPQCISLCKML
ncbi:RGM domain family member B [Lonchura striata]|uniref:RGM domain family member B n=1 Tax=Lonchura striata TaxID=40157 RepID=A0A218V5B3_9PASE|nr:RGM domain family member B [Lonchura striata domestica]